MKWLATEGWSTQIDWAVVVVLLLGCAFGLGILVSIMGVSDLCYVWGLHVMVAIGIIPIAVLSRNRVHWYPWEFFALVVPFLCWMLLAEVSGSHPPKSLGNLTELVWIGGAVLVTGGLRVVLGNTKSRLIPVLLFLLLCGAALAVFYLTPTLPESSLER